MITVTPLFRRARRPPSLACRALRRACLRRLLAGSNRPSKASLSSHIALSQRWKRTRAAASFS
jgi:hypothetical protein